MVAQVEYSVAGRSRGRVAPCAVCTGHVETRSAGFLVEPQNQGGGRFLGLGLKTSSSGLVIWALKSPRWFPGLGLKTGSSGLVIWASKSLRRFSGLDLKTGSSGLVIWASKSPRRFLGLSLKTKWASLCRLRHKTDGGRSARDTRRDLAACLTSKQV
jgi:hypothetical protein